MSEEPKKPKKKKDDKWDTGELDVIEVRKEEKKPIKKKKQMFESDKNEILYLRGQISALTTKVKAGKTAQKTINNQSGVIQELQKEKTILEKDLIECAELQSETQTTMSIEAPYVHVKITKILGGKGKKGEVSLSAGGSIEKINTDDIEKFGEMMLNIINERIDYALQELSKEETE